MTFNEIKHIASFKANIFIDWLNVKANGGHQLDYFKVMDYIREKGGIVCRANIYLPYPENVKVRDFQSVKVIEKPVAFNFRTRKIKVSDL